MKASYTGRSFAHMTVSQVGCRFLCANADVSRDKIKGTFCNFWFNLSQLPCRGFTFIITPHFATAAWKVLSVLVLKYKLPCVAVVSHVTPCSLVDSPRSRKTCCLLLDIEPWRWNLQFTPKRWHICTNLHGVMSRKTVIWTYLSQLQV
jgi:hypothetical protein